MKNIGRDIGSSIKWMIRIITVLFILMLIIGAYSILNPPNVPPTPSQAPWGIQTFSDDKYRVPSRIYYAKEVKMDGNTPVIKDYFTYDGKNYHFVPGDKTFPFNLYGNVSIVRRNATDTPITSLGAIQ